MPFKMRQSPHKAGIIEGPSAHKAIVDANSPLNYNPTLIRHGLKWGVKIGKKVFKKGKELYKKYKKSKVETSKTTTTTTPKTTTTTTPKKTGFTGDITTTTGHKLPHYGKHGVEGAENVTRQVTKAMQGKISKIESNLNLSKMGPSNVTKIGSVGGRPLVNVKFPSGQNLNLLQSTGGGGKTFVNRFGKRVSSEGRWYPHMGHMNRPYKGRTLKNWFIKSGQGKGGWDQSYGTGKLNILTRKHGLLDAWLRK